MTMETYYSAKAVVAEIRSTEDALDRVPDDPKRPEDDTSVATARGTVDFYADEARAVFGTMRAVLQERLRKLEQELEDL